MNIIKYIKLDASVNLGHFLLMYGLKIFINGIHSQKMASEKKKSGKMKKKNHLKSNWFVKQNKKEEKMTPTCQ